MTKEMFYRLGDFLRSVMLGFGRIHIWLFIRNDYRAQSKVAWNSGRIRFGFQRVFESICP